MPRMTPTIGVAACIKLLRKGVRTKAQLARELGVSTRTVRRYFRAIEDAGWLLEVDDDHKGGPGGSCERMYVLHSADVASDTALAA